MFVGEQPGDKEDRAGRPFVGPAGRELDRALEAAGIERDEAYLTNVVKHFKFEERGGRRIHQTPKRFEVEACQPVARGGAPRSCARRRSCCSARPPRRRCSEAPSG